MVTRYVLDFFEISLNDVPRVGGKNASLGELFRALAPTGLASLDGFATTADAYRLLLATNDLDARLRQIFASLNSEDLVELATKGQAARTAVLETPLPEELRAAILASYERLCTRLGGETEMAVRSSATAEDLPEASFAGAAETFLNVRGREGLLRAVQACYSSLFTDRAISYRARLGYDQLKVALSVGVMPMVRSDKASSGCHLHSRHRVRVPRRRHGLRRPTVWASSSSRASSPRTNGPCSSPRSRPVIRAIIGRRLGTKEVRLVYADGSKAHAQRADARRGTRPVLPDG